MLTQWNYFFHSIIYTTVDENSEEKSRIWETKHLSTDADSSTDEKRKKSSKTQKLKNV